MKYLFFIFCFFIHSLAIGEEYQSLYRVIFASPYDFTYAMKYTPHSTKAQKESNSRLQKIFKIRKKVVRHNSIEVTVSPLTPLAQEFFDNVTLFHFIITPIEEKTNQLYRYKITGSLKNGKTGQAILIVTPHPQGSVLQLDIQKTNYPKWMVDAMIDASIKMGFASNIPPQ